MAAQPVPVQLPVDAAPAAAADDGLAPVPGRVAFLCRAVAHGGATRVGAARMASMLRQELDRWINELAEPDRSWM